MANYRKKSKKRSGYGSRRSSRKSYGSAGKRGYGAKRGSAQTVRLVVEHVYGGVSTPQPQDMAQMVNAVKQTKAVF